MQYFMIEFTKGFEGRGYMEVSDDVCQRLTDLNGDTISVDPVEYHVIDGAPPTWGAP